MSKLIVQVEQGKLQGVEEITSDGVRYYRFSGIPYAEPPIGALRFKDPVPKRPWEGIKNATKEGNPAAQYDTISGVIYGSEDCLYLNVYVPANVSKDIPVFVNIHAGGFVSGSGSIEEMGPDYVIKEDVIMVTFDYRLTIFGFLCTDSINARGDMGLKDQNVALRWIKDNIRSFGGNPDNITLQGVSAGSASVEYHLLSKMSKGLFHKAIMQSGSTLNPFARTRGGPKMAERLARNLGYETDETDATPEDVFAFINNQDTHTLIKGCITLLTTEDLMMGTIFSFTPVINELEGYSGFIDGEPIRLLEKGDFQKVPMISGLCDKEGIMMPWFYNATEEAKRDLEARNFYKYVPAYVKEFAGLEGLLKDMYKKRPEDKNDDDDLLDFLSDVSFNGSFMYSFQQRLKHNHNKDFLYQFSHDGNHNLVKVLIKSDKVGASHADDINFLGPCKYLDPNDATEADIRVRNWMVKMWTNFAKYGNPTPECFNDVKWLPAQVDNHTFLDIGVELKMYPTFYPERTKLWSEMYSQMKI